ncbi:MAG: DUF922 domain-containing protein [Pirellulaceae bacterium]
MMRPVSCCARCLLACTLAIASVVVSQHAHAQVAGQEGKVDAKSDRPYGDGPLTEADFRGKPSADGKLAGNSFQAYLFMDIVWSSQYRTAGRGRVASAQLTQFQASAVTYPGKSWNRWKKFNPDLLDHEQGHFDLTHIHALRLEIKMRKLLAGKMPPAGSGETEGVAVEALNTLLLKEYAAVKAAADEENIEYDLLTAHGIDLEKQREIRRVHQETLKKLAAELKAVEK